MKAWIQKNLLPIVLVLLVLLGQVIILLAHQQQSVTATVTEVSETVYHKPRTGRAKSKGEYRQQIYFTYIDEAGEEQSASFTFRTVEQEKLSKAGDTITVVPWLNGWTAYPNETVITLGAVCSILAVVYLIIVIYVRFEEIRTWWQKHRRKRDDPWT